jgi:hypothetical protein
VSDSLLVINDFNGSRKVLVFNIEDGQLLEKFNLKGSGPEELQNIHDFIIENQTFEFFDFSQGKLIKVNDTLLETNNIFGDKNPLFVEKDNSRNYWYSYGWGIESESAVLKMFNRQGDISAEFFKMKSNAFPFDINPFTKNANILYYHQPFSTKLYKLEEGKLHETFTIKYKKSIPDNFHSGDFFDVFDKMNTSGFYIINKYFENRDFVYVNYRFQKSDYALNVHLLRNIKTKENYYFSANSDNEEFELGSAISITEDNELIFVIHPYTIKKLDISDAPVNILDNPYVLYLNLRHEQ